MKKQPGYPVYRGGAYQRPVTRPRRHKVRFVVFALVLLLIAGAVTLGGRFIVHHTATADTTQTTAARTQSTSSNTQQAAIPNACASNTTGDKLILVSISKRHLWACDGTTERYDSAVVTGMEQLAADLTPTGTYHITSKQTGLYLNGSDSTGSWHDYVHYWMPFLNNQYGTYGFHDATWRADSDFGSIDPNSSNASHGCVELPLATAKWLYNWAAVGTALTIQA